MFESVENNRKMILGAYRKLKSYYYYDKTILYNKISLASLNYVKNKPSTNGTLRARFQLGENERYKISRIFNDACEAKLIKAREGTGMKNREYIPYWAPNGNIQLHSFARIEIHDKKVDIYVNSAYHTLYIVLSGEMQHDFCLRNGIFVLHSEYISAKVNSTDVSANYRDDTGDLHVTHNCVSKYL